MSSETPHVDIESGHASNNTPNTPFEVDIPPDPETGKGFLKPLPETTLLERITGGAAGVSVVTALAAMIIEGGAIIVVGGILSALVGPYAYYQQTQLTDIKALQETQQKIQIEVDRLAAENNRLARNIDEMSETVQGLQDVENALEIITNTQGQNVAVFAEQVNENRKILHRMQQNLKANVLQNLLSLVFGSDTNQDNIVNDNEADDLVRRIGRMSGVEVHEDKLREAIVGKEVSAVMDVIRNLLTSDSMAEEDRIFVIQQ